MALTLEELREREKDVERQKAKAAAAIQKDSKRIDRLQKEVKENRERKKELAVRQRELEKAIKQMLRASLWTTRACLDGTTTWLGLKLFVVTVAAKTPWDGTLVAADRTSHADDCGDRMSQAELYAAYQNGTGNPANPPGTSSHEGVNGGNGGSPVTDQVPAGDNLPPWMWGLDVGGDGNAFRNGATSLGFTVRQMPGESWHMNLMEDPTKTLKKLGVF